tara:strand:- start:7185 stop:7664 length:480 start_codon:yes stop_codon:yes gene_type:complete
MTRLAIISILCLLTLLVATSISSAQTSNEAAIKNQIHTLFEGMRAGDSSKVSSVFYPKAIMQTVAKGKDGKEQLILGSLQNFLKAVGTPHDIVWDERISTIDVKIDGALAQAWVPYSFYRGDDFSHCGVNSLQLKKGDDGWKIIYIVDTRRPTNCIEKL